ncbi:MAG: alpha-2-macroglobulin family protein [Massilibacteroides sp.]|nr:alpha-2-macroglobulin family protein [Massilibacteroides sp.]
MKKIIITLTVLLFGGLFSDMIPQDKNVKDTSDFIRELVDKIKNEKEIDEARYPALIKEVEMRAMTSANPEETAILYSLLAEMYSSFEQRNSWKFAQRTPLSGYVPDDINEWTSTIFQEKIIGAFHLSLQPAERLQQIPIGKYAAILQTGKDEDLRPTLYDYLLYRVLGFNPTDDLYQALLAYKKKADNPEALLLASLDYLKFTYSTGHLRNERSAYLASLDSLYQAYALYDFAAEVWIERIQCLESGSMEGDGNQIVTVYPEIADLCRQAIDRYPLYKRIVFFKNKLMQIQNPELQVSMPSVVYPRQEIVLNLNYKNLKSIHIKIYETDRKPETLNAEEWGLSRNSKKESIHRRLIRQVRSLLTVPPLYQSADTTIRISGLEGNGIYECEFLAPDTDLKSSQLVYVTNLMAVSRSGLKNGSDILVTNMCSGKPVGRAMVLLYGYKSNKRVLMDSLFTDENGLVKVPAKENIRYYRVVNKEDMYMPFSSLYPGKAAWRIDSGKTTTVALFTDRGLYRPGQSVFVKGLVYASEKENRQVVSGKTVKVILRDANHKEITRQTFTTNEFGSFNGEFLLPKYGLNGSFSLSAENTTQSFRVEEYKRPSFFLKMDSVRGEIAFGDTVRLSGKAQTFSGSALQKGTAGYRVILRPFRLFSDRFGFSESQVANGEAILDENGSFAFNFVPEKPAYTVGRTGYSSYEVIVTLTDSRGETQEIRSSFSVGTNSIVLSTDLSENEKKETCSVRITALTLNGEMVSVQGRFMLYPLTKSEERPNSEAVLIPGDVVRQGNFSTETTLTKTVFASLPSGRYRLRLEALDGKGRMIEGEQDFVLYSEKDKRPPVFSDIWLLERELFASPQEDVEFVLGTSYKKAYVLYELVADGKLVLCKRLELSNENRKITIPFLASYGDGAVASFTFVKEGKLHTRQVRIYKKLPNKKLILKTETFRDRLAPGSRETWRFKVMSLDSLPAIAEILASMYDASLDAIAPFDWYFSPEYRPYLAAPVFGNNPAYFLRNSFASGTVNYLDVPEFEYSRFDWQNALLASPVYMTKRSYASASIKGNLAATEDMAATGSADVMEEVAVGAGDIKKESGGEEIASSLRRNFQETAFFFPVLRTDKGGNWMVNFTLPESNTTWKFQALAHTTDLKYGQLTQKVVSNKSLMVLPYIPRFVRNGDEIDLRAQIMNRSEQELKGRIRLELSDPETEENVVCLTKAQIPFSLDAGRQTTVNWRVLVPAGYELVGVRVLAETEMGSDGEQHLLPVLPNEMLITESTPFYLPGEKEKEIEFPAVPEEAIRTYRQVFELSANPVWYAVQALSTLLRPENSSASSWFAAYYSNTLASFIVRSNSRMRTAS